MPGPLRSYRHDEAVGELDLQPDISARQESGVQGQNPGGCFQPAAEAEGGAEPSGGDASHPGELVASQRLHVTTVAGAPAHRVHERQHQKVSLQARLLGQADEGRPRPVFEPDVGPQLTGVVTGTRLAGVGVSQDRGRRSGGAQPVRR